MRLDVRLSRGLLFCLCVVGCYRSSTNLSPRSKPLRRDLPRILCSFWPSSSQPLQHLLLCLLLPPYMTPPPPPPCLLSRRQWLCSTAPGNKLSRIPPLVAPHPPHPATPLLCPLWPLLLTFSRLVYTSASKPTLIPTPACNSSTSLQHKEPSPSCPNRRCGTWALPPAQTLTCRSWVWLHSSSSVAA